MTPWPRRPKGTLDPETKETVVEVGEQRLLAKILLRQAADLIFQIQHAAEEMERVLKEIAEVDDVRRGNGDVAGDRTQEE